MNAHERLRAGQSAAMEGRHEEALDQFVWFHDHAVAEEPALYGVRLSFALSCWKDLGEHYPKALRVLRRKRDEKARSLLLGDGDRKLFHDVESINDTLNETKRTHTLYARLMKLHPELARSCAALALPAVVAAKDFKLAEKLLPDPSGKVERFGRELNDGIERQKNKPRRQQIAARRALIHNYVDDVQVVLTVLEARARSAEALTARRLALSVLTSESVRRAVRRRLANAQ
jgi:hypothetical protein